MAEKDRYRLDKILANSGIGSRREIKAIVKAKRVLVNGVVAKEADMQVRLSTDTIEVDGSPVLFREYIYLLMNKPQGVLSATEDNHGEVVVDLLRPEHQFFKPFPVGRLDKDTEGLLLLTNDGKLAHELLAPKKHVAKTYYAQISGEVTAEDGRAFAQGVVLDDGYKTLPGELHIIRSGAQSEIKLTIYEGKFHQVKRMFAAVGKKVTYLKRLTMGTLQLDDALAPGEYRELTVAELAMLAGKEAPEANNCGKTVMR